MITLIAQSTICNFGVQLDSKLDFDAQAQNCVKSCFYHLRPHFLGHPVYQQPAYKLH